LVLWRIARKLLTETDAKDDYGISLVAVFAALIFVLHPVQTQAVTYIYQRHTCLATFFVLSSFLCWIKAVTSKRYRLFLLGLSFLLSTAGMFTKEISVVIPFIMGIHFFCFKKSIRAEIKTWKVVLWCVFLLVLFLSIVLMTNSITPSAMKQVDSMRGIPGHVITQKDYFLTQGQSFLIYLKLIFFPMKQNIDYDIFVSKSLFSPPETFAGFFLIAVVFVLTLIFLKKNRIVSFALAFFVVSIIPQSSIIPKPDLVVEHRLYLAMAGFAILFPFVLYQLIGQRRVVFTIFLSMIMLFYVVLTYQRNNLWKDPLKLWNDAVTKSPNKARPYLNRGLAYAQKGDIENAIKDYTTAIELNPWFVEAYNNRGILFASIKEYQLALENFNRAIELNPEYAIAYNNRAVLYCSIGKWELALKDFDTALKYEPDYVDPLKNRGIAYLILKDMKSAIRDFTRAIEKDPKNGELYNYRALSYLFENELSSAEKDIRIAVKLGYKIHPALKSLIETSRKP
ncbi:MAG: tetratricopeptide repeat protein, partial [Candidatus Omnitrophica bacterium]|nr:tetratricopeptide repeat protein [Candidatus Omnitrophota bacterium]